jgi:cytochrome c biogenesis protein CcmG, thiol:disulfide interchange protein DsbE
MNRSKTGLDIFVLVLGLFFQCACSLTQEPEPPGPAVEGQTAPNFRVRDQSGQQFSLSDFRGKVVLVNFWATWCSPCREEMPSLQSLLNQMDATYLKLLALSVDDSWEPVNEFMRESGTVLPVYGDFDKQVATRYGTLKFPETYVVDKKGRVALKVIGATDWAAPAMVAYLRRLASESS